MSLCKKCESYAKTVYPHRQYGVEPWGHCHHEGDCGGKSADYWKALAFFLAKERKRHLRDVDKINDDLLKISKLGIEIPDPDADVFIEVPGKTGP